MSKRTQKQQSLMALVIGFLFVIILNLIGFYAFKRFDLTAEKRYTLSDATIKLLQDLDDVAFFKIYLEGDDLDANYKRLRIETKEMLDEFRIYAGDNIQYEFINPSESDSKEERYKVYEQLTKKGLQATTSSENNKEGVTQKILFPGAIISYKQRETAVQLLKTQFGFSPEVSINSSVQGLEYEISNSIRKLATDNRPKVAVLAGHGELSEIWLRDFVTSLREYYDVSFNNINENIKGLAGKDALIIAKPDSAFSEKDKFVIDQFVMHGGKVLWMVDPVYAEMDSLRDKPVTYGLPLNLNIEDQLFKYGVRLNSNLVLDITAAPIPMITGRAGNQNQRSLLPWYFFPLSFPYTKHPIVNNLNAVKFDFASSIDLLETKSINKTVLLTTSKYSRTMNAPVRISLELLTKEPEEKQYNKSFLPLAVLLEGKFESLYNNRISPQIAKDSAIDFKPSSIENKMIVIADGDVCKNQVQKQSMNAYPLGYDRFSGQTFGNKNFLLNCMNYLLDNSGLISVRSRELKLRLLDKKIIEEKKTEIQVANISIPVILIVVLGITQFIYRRKKYSVRKK
jgi:ABC-2 type transport system permease protein